MICRAVALLVGLGASTVRAVQPVLHLSFYANDPVVSALTSALSANGLMPYFGNQIPTLEYRATSDPTIPATTYIDFADWGFPLYAFAGRGLDLVVRPNSLLKMTPVLETPGNSHIDVEVPLPFLYGGIPDGPYANPADLFDVCPILTLSFAGTDIVATQFYDWFAGLISAATSLDLYTPPTSAAERVAPGQPDPKMTVCIGPPGMPCNPASGERLAMAWDDAQTPGKACPVRDSPSEAQGTYCGHFSGGASIEDYNKPVCARETNLHHQDMGSAWRNAFDWGRRKLQLDRTPPKHGYGSASHPDLSLGTLGKVTECSPANLPSHVNKDKVNTPEKLLDLIGDLHKTRHEPCPSDMHLVLAMDIDGDGGPVDARVNWPPCHCDKYNHPDIHTVEDIEAMYKMTDRLDPSDKGWFDKLPTMCMRATQSFYAELGSNVAKHHDEVTCYGPHEDFPTVGQKDGGELSFYGCRSDMIACKHVRWARNITNTTNNTGNLTVINTTGTRRALEGHGSFVADIFQKVFGPSD